MKVLFDHPNPFSLAHGGFQTQIEGTKSGLEEVGIEVEWLRWWDDKQSGDLIHHFGPASTEYLNQARVKGIPTVMTTLFTATCNRSAARLRAQGAMVQAVLKAPFGQGIKQQLNWMSYRLCDLNVVGLEAERKVLELVYQVPRERSVVVPLGLSDRFLTAGAGSRNEAHLVCVGTITERKNSVPLAQMARRAEVPILFVGKPYSESDSYWREFSQLIDNRYVQYRTHVESEDEMIRLLQRARGAVVMSKWENWCLVAHEAAACGLPLLLPSMNWSRERFGDEARYFDGTPAADVEVLRRFFDDAKSMPAPAVKLMSWREVASLLVTSYQRLLITS